MKELLISLEVRSLPTVCINLRSPDLSPVLPFSTVEDCPVKGWMITFLTYMQELKKANADMATVIEGFFNGAYAAKMVDRSLVVVRDDMLQGLFHCCCATKTCLSCKTDF